MASGLLGLTQSINDRQSATQELAVLDQMDQKQQAEQGKEMQAQIMQDQMYSKMYEQADTLLGKDRKRINNQIKMAQSQVQGALDKYGASKSKFLANGGMSLMTNMQTDILHSDEAERYKQNKDNLARIMEMQEKGLGHLISPNDLQTVEDYHANDDGATITYSGVMSEVEIPHDKFALDEEINPYYIMNHSSNMMKILGNYAKVYPDRPEPEMGPDGRPTPRGAAQIVAFMNKMGYGGMGQSAALMQQKMAKQTAQAKADKAAEPTTTVLGTMNQMDRRFQGLKASEVTPDYMEKFMQGDDAGLFRDMLGEDNNFKARARDFTLDGNDIIGETVDWFAQDMIGLRGSKMLAIPMAEQKELMQTLVGVKADENGFFNNVQVTGDMYGSDGTQIKNAKRFGANDYGKKFQPMGIVTAWESAVADGSSGSKNVLLTNAYDDNGSMDKEATEKRFQGDGPARLGYYVAMQGEDGDMVYKKMDISQSSVQSALRQSYKSNDISDQIKEEKQNDQYRLNAQKMTQEEQFEYEDYKAKAQAVFKEPMFEQEAAKYYQSGSGGQVNRSEMMQAFYMAYEAEGAKIAQADPAKGKERLTKAIDSEAFSNYMTEAGLTNDLKDFNQHPEELIGKFLVNINKNYEPGSMDFKAHEKIAMKWQQILDTL